MSRKKQLKSVVKFSIKLVRKLIPLAILLYAVTIIVLTIYWNEKISPIFIFFCVEMFLNWYCVYHISCKSNPIKDNKDYPLNSVVTRTRADDTAYKFWYCEKCQVYMCKPVQHCSYCRKCYHFKDHHCFVLGVCLLRQNMGNLILFCFYAWLACIYSMYVMGWWIFQYVDQIMNNSAQDFNLFENFCFPVTLIRLLSKNVTCISLFLVFNVQIVVHSSCLGFAIWKLHTCLNGKQCYAHLTGKQNLMDIFGSYGLMNILFPYNGLIGRRSINNCRYQLKEV